MTTTPTPETVAWMPIETAPRDWSDVIVFSPQHEGFNCGGVFMAFYDTDEGKWIAHHQLLTIEPTHWMPLPPPPGAEPVARPPEVEALVEAAKKWVRQIILACEDLNSPATKIRPEILGYATKAQFALAQMGEG